MTQSSEKKKKKTFGKKTSQGQETAKAKVAKGASKNTPASNSHDSKPVSARALAMHRKWQVAAESMGGRSARIVFSKPAAKKLIFDLLYEAFCPMNITQIYKGLRAIVPSPVLGNCLQDMTCNNDDKIIFIENSDKAKSKGESQHATEQYNESLIFKAGRNANSTLYYVDHAKLKSMDEEERNALANSNAIAKGEETNLRAIISRTTTYANKLLSEPTNKDVTMLLRKEVTIAGTLQEKLIEARALQVHEKYRQTITQKIQRMSGQWRTRKRMCMDFMISLEENTDGMVSTKKCFAGDGPIELDSDENVAKATVKFAKDKKARQQCLGGSSRKCRKLTASKAKLSASDTSLADESFVAVLLDSQQTIRRLYVDGEEH